jgi:hypothetical protein
MPWKVVTTMLELAADDLTAILARELLPETAAITEELVGTLARDADHAGIAANELRADLRRTIEAVLRSIAEREPAGIAPSREMVRRWAECGVALESMLNAFRFSFGALWERMSELALRGYPERLPDLVRDGCRIWELLEVFCRTTVSMYRDALVEAARNDRAQRMAMIDALFEGRLADWRRLGGDLRMLGLPGRGPYVAVSAEPPAPETECIPGVEEYLRRRGLSSVWRSRAGEQVGLIELGHAAMESKATELVASLATGRVGLTTPYADVMETASALATASLARRCVPAGTAETATIEDNPLASLVAASPDVSLMAARVAFGKVMDLDAEERQVLLDTLRTWVQVGGRTAEAAQIMYCHRNTVRNRLHRLEKLSGRSLEHPQSAAELLVAAETLRLLRPDRAQG